MNAELLLLPEALRHIEALRMQNRKIVFTNGCFDILHAGHVRYLNAAKACGDILIVGLNSDASVKRIKGDKRPITCQAHRAEVLSGLSCIDFIIIFDEPDPLRLIRSIQPDVLVKGADWQEDSIIGADFVKSHGGRVERIPLTPEISTTLIIDRILKRFQGS